MRGWWHRVRLAFTAGLAEYRRLALLESPPTSADPRFVVKAQYPNDDHLRVIYAGDSGATARRTYESVQSISQRIELWDGASRRGYWLKPRRVRPSSHPKPE